MVDTTAAPTPTRILRDATRHRDRCKPINVIREAVRSIAPAPAASWLSRAVRSDQFVEVMGDLLQWLGRARSAGENDGTFDGGDDHRRQ
jgi:hypothetical protein